MHPDSFTVISPVDQSSYARRPFATQEHIEAAFARAEKARRDWARAPLQDRLAVVTAFDAAMRRRADDLAQAVTWQIGRPLWQADETGRLSLITSEMTGYAAEVLADRPFPGNDGVRRFARAQPGGLHLSICAWNYPTAMLGFLVVAPLISGNVVILKHSPQTPLIAEIAVEAFAEAGGPEGVFQALHLSHPDAEALIGAGRFAAVNFIGSVAGGRRVHAAAAGTFTNVHLELGGKDPAYIRADADIERIVPDIAEGCYSNAGQSCCSVERIYVAAEIHDRFVEALVAETEKWSIGHPVNGKPMLGPVVRAEAAQRIRDACDAACAMGARLVTPTPAELPGPAYVAPGVLDGLDHSMAIMRNELFGPMACVQRVSSDDEAVRLMNDSDYGLTASIWTADEARGMDLLDQLEAGTVYLNRCDHADLYLPWGGVKNSGMGRTNGRVGLAGTTAPKSFHIRSRLG
ncbi:MAG: aldehyde dehydrogenase family protein [Pararhodobacter sp.]|nr:aldehyde dehydrogenase family protein [Pararhodobacter sp.]